MLNPKSIYRKSPAGVAEVQTRSMGLRAELRRLLILIDGTATTDRLAAFVRGSEVDFLLAELETQGLIVPAVTAPPVGIGAAIGKGVSASRSAGPATITASTPAPPPHAAGSDGLPEPTAAQVQAVRHAAVHTLHDILGPDADRLATKIENCKDARQMRAAINEVRHILDQQVGVEAGKRFLDTVRGAAEGTR
ncbi:MAG: hypothetical protein ABIZ64_09745 [Casimicrobium sp.]